MDVFNVFLARQNMLKASLIEEALHHTSMNYLLENKWALKPFALKKILL